MKKNLMLLITLLLCVSLSCCGQADAPTSVTDQSLATQGTTTVTTQTTVDNSAQDSIAHYAELYATDHVYQDLYVKQKYLLIGDSCIVELFTISGHDQTKVIQKASVERVENNALMGFNTIEIFDKTNQSISISVNVAQADEIVKLIQ